MDCCGANAVDMGEPDSFYEIRAEYRDDVPKIRFKPRPGKTLSARRWHASFSEEGYVDIAKVLRRIQRGGVHPTIKGVVWEFLLGCYDPKSTFQERTKLREHRRSEYEKLKFKCQEMEKAVGSGRIITTPVVTDDGQPIEDPASAALQENKPFDTAHSPIEEQQINNAPLHKEVTQWKLTLHQIGLDVVRTDRTLVYYENQENQAKLWDILTVYSWIDRDIGYCQGMSDLCSPISILIEHEADAFWCFERLMRRLTYLLDRAAKLRRYNVLLEMYQRGNFKSTTTSIGVRSQLSILSSIIKAVDPKLHEHIGQFFQISGFLFQEHTVVNFLYYAAFAHDHLKIIEAKADYPTNYVGDVAPASKLEAPKENLDGGEYLFAFRMLMVLFRREFSFVDSLYLWELMWSMEYNPNLFSMYDSDTYANRRKGAIGDKKNMLEECGKFERKNVKAGQKDHQAPLSIFLVASVLEAKNKRLLKEAKGLDDVVKILNDITGNLDAKKACDKALKIHEKYLNKTKVS